jgi:hypothetical protein
MTDSFLVQLLLGLATIGLTLFLWERFSAFKWIIAATAGAIVFGVTVLYLKERNQSVETGVSESRPSRNSEQLNAQNNPVDNKASAIESYELLKKLREDAELRLERIDPSSAESREIASGAVEQLKVWEASALAKTR